jgi:type II secretory pathway pseudopilin PulG
MKRCILNAIERNQITHLQIKLKRSSRKAAAFSLVEVTLALGVAAFAFVAILGMLPTSLRTQQTSIQQTTANSIISQIVDALRADVRLPPGQESKICGEDGSCAWGDLHGKWLLTALPQTLYFTNDAKQTGSHVNESPPADAVFRATITYMSPPTVTTSIAKITVSWPAAQSDLTKVAGSVDMFAAVNR